tara:strand:+ start:301 stop:510 length:210 start_codon:yes stop_codon:yes gene_type:complete
MRKTSILFLMIGAFIGFVFGVKAVEQTLSDAKSDDEDDPEPDIEDDTKPDIDPATILKTVACKPWCRLV